MGKKAKIIATLLLAMVITGCEQKSSLPPTITVNEEDSSDWTTVTIFFNNHYRDNQGPTYMVLRNPQELQDYKEQVEFLLKRLEETERRMNVHEPEIP